MVQAQPWCENADVKDGEGVPGKCGDPAPAQASEGQGSWASACSLLAMFLREKHPAFGVPAPGGSPVPFHSTCNI